MVDFGNGTLMAKRTDDTPDSESPRHRIIFDAEDGDRISAAVQLRASKLGVSRRRRVSKSEVIAEILRTSLAEEMHELDQFQEQPKHRRK